MSKSSNLQKASFLGVDYGTACHQLRKQLMFKMARALNLHICFRCGLEITDVSDVHLDHKEAWFQVSVDLFWDLDNLAFSHAKCNNEAKRYPSRPANKLPEAPEGTSWCSGHKDYLPVANFTAKTRRFNGLDAYCKACKSTQNKGAYLNTLPG